MTCPIADGSLRYYDYVQALAKYDTSTWLNIKQAANAIIDECVPDSGGRVQGIGMSGLPSSRPFMPYDSTQPKRNMESLDSLNLVNRS